MTTPSATLDLNGQLENAICLEIKEFENHTSPSSSSIQKEQNPSQTEEEPAEETAPKRTVTGIRWFLVCVAIFSANILYGLDTTIAADIQAAVSETFDNVTLLGWLGVGFTLGSTVAILPLGKAFGTFDPKWVFLGCLIMFAAGSALCGGAPSMNAIIVGRVWAGIGGAGMYLGTLNLVKILSTPKEQPLYVGITGFVYGSGCILGPIVGGLFADSSATWRWAFYLNLLGIVLTAGVYVTFTVAFTFGGSIWTWSDGRIIALIVVFGILTIIFCVAQRYCVFTNTTDRIFPCEFLLNPQLVLLYVCMACGGAALFVSVYYIPLFFLFVYGDSGIHAAIRLLPFICFYVTTTLTCGALMKRTGYHSIWYLLSGIFMTCGAVTMYTVQYSTPVAHIYGFSILMGLGMTTTQASYAVGPLLVKPERVVEVIQYLNISQGSSQLIGLAIASGIFQSLGFTRLKNVLTDTHYSDSQIQAAIAGARSELLQTVNPELRAQCVDAIVKTIDDVWATIIAAGALWTVCSLFLTRKRFLD
ncbi:major facilitator superfamily domain-containing protein [Talaromyces proteolyticus]|uniref:Major facilitator superfamily domain-containing protein n=1 Tax=Talaromyces proteolyticus TaxID=1131652 RepID=A0AAD4KL32_9EURO|nr:major facilitator superfamily domain-containing protein [Talaromyces proteolyticus]KAH8693784.1 major facilitator superfamily domain-containing protein [Talaromyces proteolyticus]